MNHRQHQQNGRSPESTPGPAETVRGFFSTIAWTGNSIQPASASANIQRAEATGLEVGVSVRDFFNQFLWDGPLMIAAQAPPAETYSPGINSEDELTLDDFSNLF